ncbi:hypothetical protein GCM10028803_53050 [Larkinella knui]|uniref:Uncharacterized protein n=1 Tax=Larkinella knui TaxID=2025310 RepID=A0A3P1CGK9_9BACT|nr:hypothetical protein [Larkinella knui]RRB12489.1 hypothetical protein EHT87_20025 [Larkinella knui]
MSLATAFLKYLYPILLICFLLVLVALLVYLLWDMKRMRRMEQEENSLRDEWRQLYELAIRGDDELQIPPSN